MTTNKIWTYALHTTWIPVSCYLLTNHAFKVPCYLILISCDALPDWAIVVYMVGEVRLELTRPDGQWILSPLWLPIPSLPHMVAGAGFEPATFGLWGRRDNHFTIPPYIIVGISYIFLSIKNSTNPAPINCFLLS